jgi:agmatine deiminase
MAAAQVVAPAADGFAMPAAWVRHTRCWMAWPGRAESWARAGGLGPARAAHVEVARAIRRFEPVSMIARPPDVAEAARLLGRAIQVVALPVDDTWLRDTGPTFLIDGNGALAAVDWRFNAWGGKLAVYPADAAIAERLLARLGVRRYAAPVVNEGGAVDVDGEGTALTTESVMLNPNRNGAEPEEVEDWLGEYLGVDTVIWLGRGLEGDTDTDGHVDNLACFAGSGRVLAQICRDRGDPNHAPLQDNLARLKAARDNQGRRLEVIEIEQPARREIAGRRLPLSYINFYLANGAVIAPVFGDPKDQPALDALARVFPAREIVPVNALTLCAGGGGIHCITQQQPDPAAGLA